MSRKIEIIRYICTECEQELELEQLNKVKINNNNSNNNDLKKMEYRCPDCNNSSFKIIKKVFD